MKKRTNSFNFSEIEKIIGYTFKDKSLLLQAFTRTSFCNEHNGHGEEYQSNEVLEFFGDGVLSVAIISFMLNECTKRYSHGIKTELNEGDFSNLKSKLSDKQNLSKSMKSLGLQKYLRMGEGDAKLGIAEEPSVMEDLFESIIGAIYVDSDMSMEAVIKSVSGMLDMSVYTDRKRPTQSSKNALQEWCADKKHRLPPPRYETLSEDGPDHKKTYMRACYIGDKLMGRGVGKNFKIADAAAADDALHRLMMENSANMQTNVDNIAPNSDMKANNSTLQPDASVDAKAIKKSASDKTKKTEISHLAKLRAYASSEKKPSPTFKDLGQSTDGTYLVECSFGTSKAVGSAISRIDAREASASAMLNLLGIGKRGRKSNASSSASRKSVPHKQSAKSVKVQSTVSESVNKKSTAANGTRTGKTSPDNTTSVNVTAASSTVAPAPNGKRDASENSSVKGAVARSSASVKKKNGGHSKRHSTAAQAKKKKTAKV